MSNPCFEIWLLLHLKDIEEFDIEERSKILENAKISNKKNHIGVVLGILQGKDYNKQSSPEIFLLLTTLAIQRAEKLDCPTDVYPKGLGTHLYKLVRKLIKT